MSIEGVPVSVYDTSVAEAKSKLRSAPWAEDFINTRRVQKQLARKNNLDAIREKLKTGLGTPALQERSDILSEKRTSRLELEASRLEGAIEFRNRAYWRLRAEFN